MMVSAKHFEAFAGWVAKEEMMGTEDNRVESLCVLLESFNPNFDKERFITRCDELQGFERGKFGFPISRQNMPDLVLYTLLGHLSEAKTQKERISIQECIDSTLKVFPHLKPD